MAKEGKDGVGRVRKNEGETDEIGPKQVRVHVFLSLIIIATGRVLFLFFLSFSFASPELLSVLTPFRLRLGLVSSLTTPSRTGFFLGLLQKSKAKKGNVLGIIFLGNRRLNLWKKVGKNY
jgi:hypothetical protein